MWPLGAWGHPYGGYLLPPCGSKRKGGQVRFTPQQTQSLERRFANHKYLSPEDRRHLAIQLKLSDRQVGLTMGDPNFVLINKQFVRLQVKTWFQNRRAKWRRSNNISNPSNNIGISHSSMLPSSTGGLSEDSDSEDERPPLNLHINQHSNLYKYNNQFTIAKKMHKKSHNNSASNSNSNGQQQQQQRPSTTTSDEDNCGEDNDRPDTPIQVA